MFTESRPSENASNTAARQISANTAIAAISSIGVNEIMMSFSTFQTRLINMLSDLLKVKANEYRLKVNPLNLDMKISEG